MTKSSAGKSTAKKIFDGAVDGISQIFAPIIPLMMAAGILKGCLLLLKAIGLASAKAGTYQVLYNVADGFFYFLPVFLAFTSARFFKVNEFVAVMISLTPLFPTLTQLISGDGGSLTFLTLRVRAISYNSSIIPVILSVILLYFLEKLWRKLIPDLLFGLLSPIFSLVISVPLLLLVFGPIGSAISDAIAGGYQTIYNVNPIVAGFVLGAAIQPMVSVGLHWGLMPIIINNLAVNGTDTILPISSPASFAVIGVIFAIALKTKLRKQKALAVGAGVSAVCSETSPALFGFIVPLRKPMIYVVICGGIGGAVAGATGAVASAFAFASPITLPAYMGPGFIPLVITCVCSTVLAFVMTMVFGYGGDERLLKQEQAESADADDESN